MKKQRQERRAIEHSVLKAAQHGTAKAPGIQMTRRRHSDIDAETLQALLNMMPPSEPGTIRPLVVSDPGNRESVVLLRLADFSELLRRAGLNPADK